MPHCVLCVISQLAFQHWRANLRPKAPPEGGAQEGSSSSSSPAAKEGPTEGGKEGGKGPWSTGGKTETIEGISLICFNKHLQVECKSVAGQRRRRRVCAVCRCCCCLVTCQARCARARAGDARWRLACMHGHRYRMLSRVLYVRAG